MAYTTFNRNINDQLKEPMFFGNAVNVSRYDQQKYPIFEKLIENAEKYNFDFTTNLHSYSTKVLFLYSERNQAYGADWATTVSSPYPDVQLEQVKDCGHEMLYFGWTDLYPKAAAYLNSLK